MIDRAQYCQSAVKRACERLLQLSIETSIDICKKLVIGLKLGIPQDESDIFEKLRIAGIVSPEMLLMLKRVKGLRNVLVHEYAEIDDNIIFDTLVNRLEDFQKFKVEILQYLNK